MLNYTLLTVVVDEPNCVAIRRHTGRMVVQATCTGNLQQGVRCCTVTKCVCIGYD